LFVNPEDFIHRSQPTLFYWVGFDVLEVEDCHVPSDSSSSDGGDGLSSGHGGFSQSWPKKTHFSIVEDVASWAKKTHFSIIEDVASVNDSGGAPPGGSASAGFWVDDLAVPWSASPPAASSPGMVPQPEAHVGLRECARVSTSPKGKVSIMHVTQACLQDLEQFQISSPSGSVPCTGRLDPMWVEAAYQHSTGA
jgi:hypothetical protein